LAKNDAHNVDEDLVENDAHDDDLAEGDAHDDDDDDDDLA